MSSLGANNTSGISRQLCLSCKGGRLLCGAHLCPLLPKVDASEKVRSKLSSEMFGPSTSLFVGWGGYPHVFAGPMTAVDEENADVLDNPGAWYGRSVADIIQMRTLLVRGKQKRPVDDKSKYVEKLQELALSVRPVDVESHFRKPPLFNMSFSMVNQPMGASGELKKFKLTENPLIPQKVDYVISDDLAATDQAVRLFDAKFDVYYLTNILSSGVLGSDNRGRMVPTRWSITAVDDLLGKELIGRIRNFPEVRDVMVYENTYLDNHFEILLMPGHWNFELFEAWSPNTLWTKGESQHQLVVEHEMYRGRKDYAYNEGGGYYAGRFAVAEALYNMRRQARCVVFREIYESYVVPVGVWEVRENIRHALQNKPRKFNTVEQALSDIGGRLNLPINRYVQKSTILRQRRITDYTGY